MSRQLKTAAVNRVAVIGAGPAGSFAAIRLAQSGFDTTLIEQKTFPRDKVCGECLSSLGLQTLSSHGLLGLLEQAGLHTLSRGQIHGQDDATFSMPLPAAMGGITRRTMDQTLLTRARDAGATILQPVRCEGRTETSLTLRSLDTNQVSLHEFDLVVQADGKPRDGAKPTHQFGIKTHFRNIELDPGAIHLFSTGGTYGGIARVEDGLWNAAFVVNAGDLKLAGGDVGRLFESTVALSPQLARAMRFSTHAGAWVSCPLPRYSVARQWPDGVIPLGNAAAALEPIGGEGMGLALASSSLAVDEIIRARDESRPINVGQLRTQFGRLWRTRRAACRACAVALSHPKLANFAVDFISAIPSIQGLILKSVGKSAAGPATVPATVPAI